MKIANAKTWIEGSSSHRRFFEILENFWFPLVVIILGASIGYSFRVDVAPRQTDKALGSDDLTRISDLFKISSADNVP